MSIVSLRMNDEEMQALTNASKLYGCGISSMIKRIVFERLEDEYDLQVIADYETKKKDGVLNTEPIENLWKELDL